MGSYRKISPEGNPHSASTGIKSAEDEEIGNNR